MSWGLGCVRPHLGLGGRGAGPRGRRDPPDRRSRSRPTGPAACGSSLFASCRAIASTSLESTATSDALRIAGQQHAERVVRDARGQVRVADRADEHLGGFDGELVRDGGRGTRDGGLVIVEADEQQDDRCAGTIGHPQLVLRDRDEASEIGQARRLIDRRELSAQPAPFHGVANGPRQQPVRDRATNEVILRAGVQGDGPVRLVARRREDQDGGGRGLEPERLECLEGAGIVERARSRRLDRIPDRATARSGIRATSKPSASSSAPNPSPVPTSSTRIGVTPHVSPRSERVILSREGFAPEPVRSSSSESNRGRALRSE